MQQDHHMSVFTICSQKAKWNRSALSAGVHWTLPTWMVISLSSLPKRGRDVCTGIPFLSLSSHRQFAMESYHSFCLSMVSATCYGELQIQKSQKSLSLLPANMRIESIFLLSTACLLHPSRKHVYPIAWFPLSSGEKLPFLWVQCCSLILPSSCTSPQPTQMAANSSYSEEKKPFIYSQTPA